MNLYLTLPDRSTEALRFQTPTHVTYAVLGARDPYERYAEFVAGYMDDDEETVFWDQDEPSPALPTYNDELRSHLRYVASVLAWGGRFTAY